jgi:hypothetical protein
MEIAEKELEHGTYDCWKIGCRCAKCGLEITPLAQFNLEDLITKHNKNIDLNMGNMTVKIANGKIKIKM